jgi:hypothetical protein
MFSDRLFLNPAFLSFSEAKTTMVGNIFLSLEFLA